MSKFAPVKYEEKGIRLEVYGVLFESDRPEEAVRRYRDGETVFWNQWRGSFFGILTDRSKDITLLFNDHIGSKMVFYAEAAEKLVWSTDPFKLARKIGAKADNENFLWQMLLYGYSPIGETAFRSISRLLAGEYIYACGGKIEKRIYHRFDNTPNNLSIDENIERIDRAFRRAVERVIKKNEECGYMHFIALSAGLDSRMVNRVAHEIAATPIHNITYSQSGFYDEIIPKELAEYWKNEWHFTPLDGGECLRNLDEVSRITYGLIQYSGAAETLYGLPEVAKEKAGVFLTGMVGDIIVGTAYTRCREGQGYHAEEAAIILGQADLMRSVLPSDFEHLFPNREVYYLYTRGFNCANLGSPHVHQAFGESYSPFCDVDVLEAAYAAPVEQRWGHRLYDQWILRKYPDMSHWKHNGLYTIGHRPKRVSLYGRSMPITEVPKRIVWYLLKRLHIHDFYKQTINQSMTPEDDWFQQNISLRTWSEKYIQENIGLLNNFPKVQQLALQLNQATAMERMQVLSLLACLRQAR